MDVARSSGASDDGSTRAQQSHTPRMQTGTVAAPQNTASSASTGNVGSPSAPLRKDQLCSACGYPMTGQFVRALGGVYHLDCFRCADCGKGVASKFFSATEEMVSGSGAPGRLFPLCETDYFRRLDLLCHKCGGALRGSYVTALGAKFHVEHFTCSVCATVFGPEDSYYEHDSNVYCHFHYSTRFAIKCSSCGMAILKQFVEINRNNANEHWHPECYMIHRFWKIKLQLPPSHREPVDDVLPMPGALSPLAAGSQRIGQDDVAPETLEFEANETPASLVEMQRNMERQVMQIWRVLSAYEESSAACISDMLRHVSSGKYLGGVRFAERFVLHVEVLFSAIDDLEVQCSRAQAKAVQYMREARMLCKKIVNFFSLFSHTQESGARRMGITQELLSLVTGLAHYLKILIRISLTGALRLDREYGKPEALIAFLNKLDELVSQPNPEALDRIASGAAPDTIHGYTSLPRALSTEGESDAATDLCVQCGLTVEEDCMRVGIPMRWHLACVRCHTCRRGILRPDGTPALLLRRTNEPPIYPPDLPSPVAGTQMKYAGGRWDEKRSRATTHKIYCPQCVTADATVGLTPVTRLEQYAFLLRVALNRLYALLKKKHVAAAAAALPAPEPEPEGEVEAPPVRKSQEFRRLETVYVDRQVSSRLPRFSTIVDGPAGHWTQPSDVNNDSEAAAAAAAIAAAAPGQPPPKPRSASSNSPMSLRRTHTPLSDHLFTRDDHLAVGDGGASMSVTPDDCLTLADIPYILKAEQDREHSIRSGIIPQTQLSSLEPEEMFVLKHLALGMLMQSSISDQLAVDDLMELIEVRRNTIWGKLFKGGNGRRDVRKKGVFGVPLDVLVERNGADSTLGASATPLRIPSFVDDIVSAMKQMDMSIEGIFRKNGNVRRLRDISEMIDREQDGINLLDDNPVQLAALLKKFFRDLPEPLMTNKLYRLFVLSQQIDNESERHRVMQLIMVLLPKAHRDTAEVLFVFLRWVASFAHVDEETGSRMDLANLATVICPNILYSRNSEPQHGEALVANHVVHYLLENQDEFWVVPSGMEAILKDRDLVSNATEMSPVELMKRCAKYAHSRDARS
ncbi:Rho-type GTPase activating protein Rga1 [Malassezia cuniculi]|uniref:Rho-type GTPase activating protein Rga1 n=1 Tax=Malassezia cuniculi TaxID=948313 RepID=A0AAF0ERV1_9BASI|nr:Rho-type GTPase activating protein Rga1 [Malassezia cuniculi]